MSPSHQTISCTQIITLLREVLKRLVCNNHGHSFLVAWRTPTTDIAASTSAALAWMAMGIDVTLMRMPALLAPTKKPTSPHVRNSDKACGQKGNNTHECGCHTDAARHTESARGRVRHFSRSHTMPNKNNTSTALTHTHKRKDTCALSSGVVRSPM